MRKPRTWYCDIYDQHFEFCLGWSNKSLESYLKHTYNHDIDSSDSLGLHLSYGTGKKAVSVIWVEDKTDLPVIAHECLHAAIRTLDKHNIKTYPDNHEALSYLFEIIFKKAIN